MNHAKVHGHIETNPANGIRRNPRRKLNRFLSRIEIRRLYEELDRGNPSPLLREFEFHANSRHGR